MERQQSLRPQDIIVALKLANLKKDYLQKDLAAELSLSQAELIKSFRRLKASKIMSDAKQIDKSLLLNFIEHGMAVCFPVQLSGITSGIATAYSHKDLKSLSVDSQGFKIVWPSKEGKLRGQGLAPLYTGLTKIHKVDSELYKNVCLLDLVRLQEKKSSSKAMKLLRTSLR